MDWGSAKQIIVGMCANEGNTIIDLKNVGIASPADVSLQLWLRNFTVSTLYHYTMRQAVQFVDNDWETIDLTDGSRTSKSFHQVRKLYINGVRIGWIDSIKMLEASDNQFTVDKGAPRHFTEVDKGKISFERPIDASTPTNAAGFVSGFFRHPVLTADSGAAGTLLLDDTAVYPFCKYASIYIKENVTDDESAMGVLKRFDIQAYNFMLKIRAEKFTMFAQSSFDRGDCRSYYP